jgi:hypothetical protein
MSLGVGLEVAPFEILSPVDATLAASVVRDFIMPAVRTTPQWSLHKMGSTTELAAFHAITSYG